MKNGSPQYQIIHYASFFWERVFLVFGVGSPVICWEYGRNDGEINHLNLTSKIQINGFEIFPEVLHKLSQNQK